MLKFALKFYLKVLGRKGWKVCLSFVWVSKDRCRPVRWCWDARAGSGISPRAGPCCSREVPEHGTIPSDQNPKFTGPRTWTWKIRLYMDNIIILSTHVRHIYNNPFTEKLWVNFEYILHDIIENFYKKYSLPYLDTSVKKNTISFPSNDWLQLIITTNYSLLTACQCRS